MMNMLFGLGFGGGFDVLGNDLHVAFNLACFSKQAASVAKNAVHSVHSSVMAGNETCRAQALMTGSKEQVMNGH